MNKLIIQYLSTMWAFIIVMMTKQLLSSWQNSPVYCNTHTHKQKVWLKQIFSLVTAHTAERNAHNDQMQNERENSGNRKNVSQLHKVASTLITLYGFHAKTISRKKEERILPKITWRDKWTIGQIRTMHNRHL